MREGLPNALCEAMLCGCVPVGTKRNGIPTAIGDCGFYVPYDDPKAAAEAIKKRLAQETWEKGQQTGSRRAFHQREERRGSLS
jgi:glycosyltransferase involved in cell wall biosynthesis